MSRIGQMGRIWLAPWSRKVRESSDCFTKFHESARKFAQIRAVVTRCLASQARHKLDAQVGCSLARNVVALLRVGPIFGHGCTQICTDSEKTLNRRKQKTEGDANWGGTEPFPDAG